MHDESRLTFVVSIWLKDNDVAGFESFERQAAAIMAAHGGHVDNVVRCGGEGARAVRGARRIIPRSPPRPAPTARTRVSRS